MYGQYLTYMLVLLPLAWLTVSSLLARRTETRTA
jgi:heme exporter protein D